MEQQMTVQCLPDKTVVRGTVSEETVSEAMRNYYGEEVPYFDNVVVEGAGNIIFVR